MGRGYRVVAVDARGHGLSPRWEPAQLERAGEVLVEDLIAVLEELEAASCGRAALGLPTPAAPVVIGHSMGAATAMVAAVRRPDLVTGVVLEDPARFGTRSPRELLARGAARERARAAEVADLPAAVGRALETMPDAEALPGVWGLPAHRPGPAALRRRHPRGPLGRGDGGARRPRPAAHRRPAWQRPRGQRGPGHRLPQPPYHPGPRARGRPPGAPQ